MATAAEKAQITETEISALTGAKARLAAKTAKLKAMQAKAKAAGNTKLATDIATELKEADGYRARIASIETMLQPFLEAWGWAKSKLGLGELGAIFVPVAAAGGIAAVVYAINVWDRKTETSLQRYEAELKAHDEWVKRGKTGAEASAIVQTTAKQYSQENASKPGLLDDLKGYVKLGGFLLVGYGAYRVWQSSQKSKQPRTA